MARRFESGFLIQTDAIVNTSELNMPLSILLGVKNTMSSFPVAYTSISLESVEAFKVINACCKELFFWDDCSMNQPLLQKCIGQPPETQATQDAGPSNAQPDDGET